MARKRRQYYVSQFDFSKVKEKDGNLFLCESDRVVYPNSEDHLYDLIYRLVDRTYDNKIKNTVPEMFTLKAYGIDEKDDEEVAKYEKAIKEGIYIDGIKYVYSQKSSSMIRTQKVVYILESLQPILEEHIMLGAKINKAIPARLLSYKGLLMSTSHLMPYIPNIVVIEDYDNEVIGDVKMVLPYEITGQDKIDFQEMLEDRETEKERYTEYKEKCKEISELFTNQYLVENFTVRGGTCTSRSRSAWTREGKRVKVEELENPRWIRRLQNGMIYPVYIEGQTEDIKKFPINKQMLGYETKIFKKHTNGIEPFDGMGLASIDYMGKVEKFLEVQNTNAIQGRLPFVKGLFIKFDFKKYFEEELNTYEIKDLWGNMHRVSDIDILVTKSCFKAQIDEDDEGNKNWLFEDMQDYYKRLDKYGYTKFGISNYANDKLDKYAPTTYQLINAMDLSKRDLIKLAREEIRLIKNVVNRGDTASVKLFLEMVSSKEPDEDDEDKTKLDYIKDAIALNERMVFDKEVQKTLFDLAQSSMYEIMKGRIRIPSHYQYVTGDIIGFCEWAAYRNSDRVKGFLGENEFYCKGMENEGYILARYPLTHYSEVKIAPFVESNNPYMEHLHNIIQFNMYGLTMAQLAGCDHDGDSVNVIKANIPISNNRILKDAVIEDYVIVNPDDKALAEAKVINKDTIWEFEKANLHNLTGRVTNINTSICDKALAEGKLVDSDLPIAVCKYLQGLIIDSAKTGQVVTIPEALEGVGKLPYFFKYIYGGGTDQYRKPSSPLSKVTLDLEKYIRNEQIFQVKNTIGVDIEDKSYLDITKIHELMIDEDKFDTNTYFKLHEALTPVHNDFSTKRGEIYKASKDINRFDGSEEAKEQRKIIDSMYSELYKEVRERAIQATIEVCGVYNPSILASIATRIAYEDSKSGNNGINSNKNYLFGWIVAPEGIAENLVKNEDTNKTKLKEIKTPLPYPTGNIKIVNDVATMRGLQFPAKLDDCKGSVLHKQGKYYVANNVTERSNIKTTSSPSIKEDKTDEIKLKDYKCSLAFLQKSVDELEEIFKNDKVKIGMKDNQYISLFADNNFLCSFTGNSYDSKIDRVRLKDYIGQLVVVNIDEVSKTGKSLKVMISS